ncbi:MAG: type II toxin-antitoxin system CcdA family antitoxin [Nitrososphaerota archaeon]|nr:type II toxin-antitoxin system CcdA family antitoxin [Candidatus Calditenuaceae archaeon]MDW8073993.1 type II toxin-antitoxin system CcdA family antitoxin [Nitrososphaerota archaeon]
MGPLGEKVTVSVKIPHELRQRMREPGINPSEVLRKAIEEEVRKRSLERLRSAVEELSPSSAG